MINDPSVRDKLYERLRRPVNPDTVSGSLPVLFFGDIDKATIATVGINPSYQEYLDPKGQPLPEGRRRFETLKSLDAPTRAALTDEQCERAISDMRSYFQPGKPVYNKWFGSLDLVTQAMGYSYVKSEVVSLDLIQEATDPIWSDLKKKYPNEVKELLAADLPFLRWQLATFPLLAVVCNGMTPLRCVCSLLDKPVSVDTIVRGQVGGKTWYATRGLVASRALIIVGWNTPLTQPPGLTTADKANLGRQLRQAIDELEQ